MFPLLLAITSPMIIELKPAEMPVIQPAIDALSAEGYTILRLAPGIYREKILVPKSAPPFKIIGSDRLDTIITFGDGADTVGSNGKELGTFNSSSFKIESNSFSAENVTFENTRGKGTQAVALSVGGDKAVFRNCRFLGWQDTLLVRKNRQFFDRCYIAGSVDFIFGDANSFFNDCEIDCLGRGYITAASTQQKEDFGFIFSNCSVISPTQEPVYLGRPWAPYASVHFLNCTLPANIRPERWDNWENPENEKTARYYEWRSSGPGAKSGPRVKWSHALDDPAGKGFSRPWIALSGWDPDTELSPDRISRLPVSEQGAWWEYVSRSKIALETSQSVLREEMKSAGLATPKRPADHGKPPPYDRDPSWYRSAEAATLAANVMSFQTPTGAWSKAVDYSKGTRETGTNWSSQGSGDFPWHYVGTIDNTATTSEIRFLARYYEASRSNEAKAAVEKAIGHLLSSQYPNGGWPQVWPLEGNYHDHITYNDDAMVHVLELMNDLARNREPFRFIGKELRDKSTESLSKGISCALASQYVQKGKPTVWCAQHDPLLLAPADARRQEPASLSSSESVGIIRFLEKEGPKTPEVVAAVRAARAWFANNALTGIRREKKDGRNFYAENTGDPEQWWPRFSDLESNAPLFPSAENGHIHPSFAALFPVSPTEYQFYSTAPRSLFK